MTSGKGTRRDALVVAAIAVAYVAVLRLAFLVPDAQRVVSAVWPAAGVGLASLLLAPRRLWPAVALAIFAAGSAANVAVGVPLLASLGFMLANVAESVGSAWVLGTLCGSRVRFVRVREVLALIGCATLVNAATACIGAGTGALVFHSPFAGVWRTWVVADGLGILLVTPLVVAWAERLRLPANVRWGRVAESAAFTAVWCATAWLAFRPAGPMHPDILRPYLLFALLPWAAFRFGPRGTAVALLLAAALSITNASVLAGPSILGGATVAERLLLVQAFLAVLGGAGLLLAASFAETAHAGRAIGRAHDRLRALGDNIPEGMVYQLVREPDGTMHFTYVSAGVERVLGVSADAVVQNPAAFFARVHEEDRERFRAARETAEGLRRPTHDVFRFRHVDGEERWIQISSAPRELAGGGTLWDGAAMDVTERTLIEKALRESEARLRLAAEAAAFGVYAWDFATGETYYSPNFLALYGQAPDTTLDLDADLVPRAMAPEDRAGYRASVLEANDPLGTGVLDHEFRIRRPDGAGRWLRVRGQTTFSGRDASAVSLRAHGILQDITERKRAEEQNAALQSQVYQSQKIESVGRLAGGVAHDFNNAVQTILLNTEMALTQSAEGSPLRRYLGDIMTSAQHSAALTAQLLAFARKQPARPRVVDLNAVIATLLPLLQRLIGEDIATVWTPGHGLWHVRADPTQVHQILNNLAVNARDAIVGVGRLMLATANVTVDADLAVAHPGLTPGDFVRLTVTDDGCGMDAETLAHVFEPFFTTKPVGAGTGLGLATVHGIVSQNGGAVSVNSAPGQGTSFAIWLPRVAAPDVGPAAPGDAAAPLGGTETLLVVEDETPLLRACTAILTGFGYVVLAADRPGAALRLAEAHEGPIALLVTDVVMPEMNGHMLADRLTAVRPTLKRLYMSGYTGDTNGPPGVVEAKAPFLAKPFTADDLGRKVRAVLDQ